MKRTREKAKQKEKNQLRKRWGGGGEIRWANGCRNHCIAHTFEENDYCYAKAFSPPEQEKPMENLNRKTL